MVQFVDLVSGAAQDKSLYYKPVLALKTVCTDDFFINWILASLSSQFKVIENDADAVPVVLLNVMPNLAFLKFKKSAIFLCTGDFII